MARVVLTCISREKNNKLAACEKWEVLATVIGHDDVPGPVTEDVAGMHWDPGPYWDWTHFMDLLGVHAPGEGSAPPAIGSAVTITPGFEGNAQRLRVCGPAAGDTEDGPDAPDG